MNVNRRTQDERSAATRGALIAAARPLFAQRGFNGVGTEEIVRAAGVTRGALYHQFADKAELFAAVFEAVEEDVMQRVATGVLEGGAADPLAALHAGATGWLDAAMDSEVQRIVLIDAPAVLGWERWREISMRYGMGLTEAALQAAMDAAVIDRQPVRPLAHIVIGALDEAALYVARAEDPEAARAEIAPMIERLLASLRLSGPSAPD
jgi:AcrR family transcriptional regulator